jgi:hypothetical protein
MFTARASVPALAVWDLKFAIAACIVTFLFAGIGVGEGKYIRFSLMRAQVLRVDSLRYLRSALFLATAQSICVVNSRGVKVTLYQP